MPAGVLTFLRVPIGIRWKDPRQHASKFQYRKKA
jgi:hypothetical protein